jgi:two-component system, OmpR family, alkaline phosphatase synthesis response regulator PhoP
LVASPPSSAKVYRNKRILIVEDERELCLTLADRFENEGYKVAFAHDEHSGIIRVSEDAYDLIILDIMLPLGSGLDLCVRMRRMGVLTPVLFLTARSHVAEKVAGFKAGGDDYLTKPFDSLELMARVEALLRRGAASETAGGAEGEYQFGPVTLDVLRKKVTLNGQAVTLTSREFQLLRYLAERSGKTVSREELLEEVWGDLSGNITRTVDMHVAGLRQKLESNPRRPELILTEPGAGYRFQP